jgi:hypothetical protein
MRKKIFFDQYNVFQGKKTDEKAAGVCLNCLENDH